ncbi:MAG: hypothetical protein H6679_02695 [Epsilonproteobacteria bacterium]|nr:hypothetical protein [Campylobacterota bacterium]
MKQNVLYLMFITLSVSFFVGSPFGEADRGNVVSDPPFVSLEPGEQSFQAVIYDEETATIIKDLSFSGQTSIDGVKHEDNDSNTKLELSKILEIHVEDSHFPSERYRDGDWAKVTVRTTTDKEIANLLIPRRVSICGIDAKTNLNKSWFLSNIDRIEKITTEPFKLPEEPAKVIKEAVVDKVEDSSSSNQNAVEIVIKKEERPMPLKRGITLAERERFHGDEHKGVMESFTDILRAIVAFIKAVFAFFRRLLW